MPGAIENALRTQRAMSIRPGPVKLRKWPRPRFPTKERLLYYRQLVAMVEQVQALVVREVLPLLPGILDAHAVTRPVVTEPVRTDTNQPRDAHGRWTASGSFGAAHAAHRRAREAHRAAPTLETHAALVQARTTAKHRRALATKVAGHDGVGVPRPAAHAAARAAFLAGHRAQLTAATAAHAAAPSAHTAAAVDHARGQLRSARRQAGSSRETPQASERHMQEDVEALHKLRRRALDPHDKHPAEAEKWKAEAEEFALGTALATPGGKWRHAALAQDIHQHNVSEPVLRQQRAKAVAEHASNQGDYEPGRRGQRELQRDVTERLRDHVGEQHATVVERLADSGIRGRAAREAVAGTHQAALGTVKHLHAEALQSIKEQGLHDAAMKAFRRARRKDAADTDIEDAFDAVGEAAQAAIPERTIGLVAQQNALRVTVWNGAELQKQVQQVAKINLFDNTTGLAEHLELFVADNVKLVKSLVFGQLDDLKGIVVRGARAGTHHTVVAEQIRERFGVTKKRAALIATDQVGKLNGELNQLRQTNLGVRRYRWSSSQDERVRKSHRKLNGSIQTWKDPPVVDQRTGERGHPGQPIRCRCQPIPIIDDVLADAGLMDPEDVELLHPAAGNVQPATKPWVPPKLPPLPSGVPQPPPANMAEAAAQAVRRAAAAPSGGTSSRTPANTNVPPSLPPRAPPAPPGGGGPPRGRGKPPGEPPSGAPGAGPLPDAPRPTKALVRRAAKLVTHDADYYDHGVDLSKLSAIDRQVFLSGPCVKLIDDAKNRAEYARWMDLWVGRSTAKLALEARRGIEVAGSAARDGYLATQAFIESRLGRLRTEGIIDPNGYVTLYRGVYDDNARAVRAQHAAGGAVSSRVRDAASWTDSLRSARAAAMGGDDGLVMHQKIHYTRIYSTYRANGYHWMRSPDAEWTVLHDDGIVEVQVMELL